MIWRTGLRPHSTPSVLPCDSPLGSSGKKASLSSFTPSPGDLSRRTRELRKVPCNVHFVYSSGFAYAVRSVERLTCGSSDRKATFVALTPTPASTLGDLSRRTRELRKVPCGFSPASAGVENATAGSEASRSDGGALREFPSFSWHGTHRSALLAIRLSALRAKRHRWRCSLRITLLAAGRPAPLTVLHRWSFCANRLPFLQKAA